jgi:hypothetical protein
MNTHEHQAIQKFIYFRKKNRIKHTRYFGENSCKSFTGISTPTAPNKIVMSFF